MKKLLLALIAVLALAGCAHSNVKQHQLPDGRTVICVERDTGSGYGTALDCDWPNAK